MSNQKRVWEEEKKALEERKRIEQVMKERQEERQIQELQEMQEAAGGPRKQVKVDWMYSGPSAGQNGTTEEMEGYLLGKRRIDGLVKGTEHKQLEKNAGEESFMGQQNANNVRDTARKVQDDPLLAIKKQEQAEYEAVMNDPVKRRLLLKAAGKELPRSREKNRKKHTHHHRHHRRRDESRDHHRSQHSYDDFDRYARSRHDHRHRRHSETSSSRSPSPYARRHSPSTHHRRRSPSYSDRSRSPPQRSSYQNGHTNGNRLHHSRSFPARKHSPIDYGRKRRNTSSPSRSRSRSPPPSRHRQYQHGRQNGAAVSAEERAARLAAMQSDARELDISRASRLRDIQEQEARAREEEDRLRARSGKAGGKGDFVTGMQRKAGEMGLAERMKRGTRGYERVGEEEER
ncbi:uncharacterized protein KY384_001123 [Bacidia gigantensis]|uniref:uncharacterized protein n=1 Tax=Bacidia gigantensis TaxID=2732470 RepID=UPI001D058A61|nr:uncharacterized protein KY384_001123 [Bacidia gigantensis]KAG8534279.1 hypothetical protein KY384_001123 [Bacidia gigantensis]